MYLEFFSLKKFPFRITPDPSMFYPGRTDGPGAILNALIYAITSGEGIIKVVGEVGSGKTMLCRMLEERLPDTLEIVYLANPKLSARDIIYAIAFELHLDVDAETERLLVMQKLQDYLLKKYSEGGAVVVFIEEAQGMPIETLEEIRLLSNLETHHHKLMQIVLFGQPELDKNLEDRSIRQLRERITHSFYLSPMTVEATQDYLRFRLQAAGSPWPRIFSPKAEKILAKAAGGLTRRINILADKALMAAYADSAIQPGQEFGALQQMVLPRHVRAAIRDSNYRRRPPAWVWGAAAGLLLALAAQFWFRPLTTADSPAPQLALTTDAGPPAVQAPVEQAPRTMNNAVAELNPAREESELPAARAEASSVPEADIAPGAIAAEESPIPEADSVPEAIIAEANPAPEAGRAPGSIAAEANPPPEEDSTPSVTVAEATPAPEANSLSDTAAVEAAPLREENNPSIAVTGAGSPAGQAPTGLIALRSNAVAAWLQNPQLADYTVQLAAFSIGDELILEEFLQLLSQANLLSRTYLCRISATAGMPEQWLVFQGDFSGVSLARAHIDSLPVYSRRYGPFVRNTGNIACL